MNHIVKPALILTLTVFCAAMLLSYAKKITDPYILSHETRKQEQAVNLVLTGYTTGEELIAEFDDGTKFSYWVGTKIEDNIEKKAYAFISTVDVYKRGIAVLPATARQSCFIYNGEIEFMIGIDEDDKILGVSIIHQPETANAFFAADIKETIANDIKDSLIKFKKAKSIIEQNHGGVE